MKKILLVVTIILVLFVMTGCIKLPQNDNNNNNSNDNEVVTKIEGFEMYSDEQLVQLIKNYRTARGLYIPEHIEGEDMDGDEIGYHLYDIIDDDHTATTDWYYINPYIGKGTNILGEEIDLIDESSSNSNEVVVTKEDKIIYTPAMYSFVKDINKVAELPYIDLKGEYIDKVNKEIEALSDDVMNDEDKFSSYEYSIKNGVLSVLVKVESMLWEGYYDILVYNIDLKTGKEVSTVGMLSEMNVLKQDFEDKINKNIIDYYNGFAGIESEENLARYSKEYILKDDNYKVFRNNEDKLFAITKIMKLAGSGAPEITICEY